MIAYLPGDRVTHRGLNVSGAKVARPENFPFSLKTHVWAPVSKSGRQTMKKKIYHAVTWFVGLMLLFCDF